MLPVIIGLLALMVKTNMAIQTSVVNQQYLRMMALSLTYNSPVYPELSIRQVNMEKQGYNHMLVGVAENKMDEESETYNPEAPVQAITNRRNAGSNAAQTEPLDRGRIRIRNTLTFCTQQNVIGKTPILPMGSDGKPTGNYALNESVTFEFCGGPHQYE